MNTKQALRLALYYRGLSALSFVVGLGIALAGLSVGLGETFAILAADFPSRVDEAMAAANLPVALGSAVVGVLVWQVGKWAAFFRTVGKVVDDTGTSATSEDPGDEPRTGPQEGRAGETDADSPAARQDPIVPSSPSGSASRGPENDRAGDPDERTGGDPIDDASATNDPIGGASPGDGPATGGRTGSPKPHEDEADVSAASGDDGSAATLSDDADSVFDGDASDAPADAVTCGDCGYPNKEGVSFCANCGAEL